MTKDRYWQKPTYESLRSALEDMRAHCLQHGVRAVSLPRIGCGLDALAWTRVKDILQDVFAKTHMRFTVYTL